MYETFGKFDVFLLNPVTFLERALLYYIHGATGACSTYPGQD